MAFLVEDGTGLAAANSYASAAEFKAYHTDRGVEVVLNDEYTDAQIEQALIRATDYVEWKFSTRFLGHAEFPAVQALSFPRIALYDRNGNAVTGVPNKLKYAISEYALRALTAPLQPDPVIDESGRAIVGTRKKVGPVEVETRFEAGASLSLLPRNYPLADGMLTEYIRAGGGVIR